MQTHSTPPTLDIRPPRILRLHPIHVLPRAGRPARLSALSREPQPREWFEQARFGNVHSLRHLQPLGDGEWVMPQRHLTGPQYEPLAAQFYPTKFAAARWATLAQQAGMRSIVVTSRHHDGFSIFATTQNKYNIVDSTPTAKTSSVSLPKSVIARVSSSSSTTHHPDYYPLGGTGYGEGRPVNGQWPRCLDFMNAQFDRAVHQLRRARRRVVRRRVGQARRRLAD